MSALHWMAWVAAIGALAAAAAFVVEPALRALRLPTRWAWLATLLAPVGIVGWSFLGPESANPPRALLVAWALATGTAAAVYLRAARRLRRERPSWRVTVAEEMPVWVSERTGPAVVGFLRSIVVAPAWAMALEPRELRLLLRHEGEHVASWDPTLLLAGLASCALVPWNLAGWWALGRLRLAIEVDCDRRVLRAEPDVRAYGELLLKVQECVVPGPASVAAFAERKLPIEERLEAMTARRPRRAGLAWGARGAAAAGLVLAACVVPGPSRGGVPSAAPVAGSAPAVTADGEGSGFTVVGSDFVSRTVDGAPDSIAFPSGVLTRGPDGLRMELGGEASRVYHRWRAELPAVQALADETSARVKVESDAQTQVIRHAVRAHLTRPDRAPVRDGMLVSLVLDPSYRVVAEKLEPLPARAPGTGAMDDDAFARRFPKLAAIRSTLSGSFTNVTELGAGRDSRVEFWLLDGPEATRAPAGARRAPGPLALPRGTSAETRLLATLVREYLSRPDVAAPAPRTLVHLAIDADGRVIGDVRVPRGDRPDGSFSVAIVPDDVRSRFPSLPAIAPRTSGMLGASMLGFDVPATVAYEYLQPAPDAHSRKMAALRAGIRHFFASQGGLPRDTAVGIVALLDTGLRVIAIRRVPVAAMWPTVDWPPDSAAAVMPELVGRVVGIRGRSTGEQFGLAPGSIVHDWQETGGARAGAVADADAERAAIGHARRYAAREGLSRGAAAVSVWVLIDERGTLLEIGHGPVLDPTTPHDPRSRFRRLGDRVPVRAAVLVNRDNLGLPDGSNVLYLQVGG